MFALELFKTVNQIFCFSSRFEHVVVPKQYQLHNGDGIGSVRYSKLGLRSLQSTYALHFFTNTMDWLTFTESR